MTKQGITAAATTISINIFSQHAVNDPYWPIELSTSARIPLTFLHCSPATLASLWPMDTLGNFLSPRLSLCRFHLSSNGTPTEAFPTHLECILNLSLLIFPSSYFHVLLSHLSLLDIITWNLTAYCLSPYLTRMYAPWSEVLLHYVTSPAPRRGPIGTDWVRELIFRFHVTTGSHVLCCTLSIPPCQVLKTLVLLYSSAPPVHFPVLTGDTRERTETESASLSVTVINHAWPACWYTFSGAHPL